MNELITTLKGLSDVQAICATVIIVAAIAGISWVLVRYFHEITKD